MEDEYARRERIRLGSELAQMRKSQGYTVRQLASKSGITPANISNIENGKISVGIDVLSRLCLSLCCEITLKRLT